MTADKKTTLKVTFTDNELKALTDVMKLFEDIYELSDKNEQVILVNDKEDTIFGVNIVKNMISCLNKLSTSTIKETA